MPSTCGNRGVSATRPHSHAGCAARRPGAWALSDTGPFSELSEKEARIAKEKELGIYKEHKVGACDAGPGLLGGVQVTGGQISLECPFPV